MNRRAKHKHPRMTPGPHTPESGLNLRPLPTARESLKWGARIRRARRRLIDLHGLGSAEVKAFSARVVAQCNGIVIFVCDRSTPILPEPAT